MSDQQTEQTEKVQGDEDPAGQGGPPDEGNPLGGDDREGGGPDHGSAGGAV